jgi:hypothetical protein
MTTNKNARTRSFSTKARKNVKPVTIELDDEVFVAHSAIPGAVLLDFIGAGSEGMSIAGQMMPFLEKAFPADEYARLQERLYYVPDGEEDDQKGIVDEELIGEIVAALIEEYTDSRPTQESDQ